MLNQFALSTYFSTLPTSVVLDEIIMGLEGGDIPVIGAAMEVLDARQEHDKILESVCVQEYDLRSPVTCYIATCLTQMRYGDPLLCLLGRAMLYAVEDCGYYPWERDFRVDLDFEVPLKFISDTSAPTLTGDPSAMEKVVGKYVNDLIDRKELSISHADAEAAIPTITRMICALTCDCVTLGFTNEEQTVADPINEEQTTE